MNRRAIVVAHGVGSQLKGQTLNDIVEPIVRFLRRFLGPHALWLAVDLRPEQGPAVATIRFEVAGEVEEWVFTEAWWAQRFYPSPAEPILLWGWRVLFRQAWNIIYGVFLRRIGLLRQAAYPDSPAPVYQDGGTPTLSKLYDFALGIAVLTFFVPAYALALALATIFYLIAQLPPWLLVVRPAAALQRALVRTLVEGVGDQYAMTSNILARESASQAIVQALAPHLDRDHPNYRFCQSVVVIAHSGGAVVSCDALTTPTVKEWLSTGELEHGLTHAAWFTVGSGLNLAYRTRPQDPFWDRELPRALHWTDLWARYDPVPHGQIDPSAQRRIRGMRSEPSGGQTSLFRFANVRVVNRDNPFADHGEYWRNYEEVVSRFVYEIMARPALGPLRDAVDAAVAEIRQHRQGVGRFVALRLGAIAAAFGAAKAGGTAARLGGWVIDRLDTVTFSLPAPLDLLVDWLAGRPALDPPWLGPIGADSILGLALLGTLAYLVYRLATLLLRSALERRDVWD